MSDERPTDDETAKRTFRITLYVTMFDEEAVREAAADVIRRTPGLNVDDWLKARAELEVCLDIALEVDVPGLAFEFDNTEVVEVENMPADQAPEDADEDVLDV